MADKEVQKFVFPKRNEKSTKKLKKSVDNFYGG